MRSLYAWLGLFATGLVLGYTLFEEGELTGTTQPLASETAASRASADADQNADFDYYLLSLSWSPSYCLANPDRRDSRQCREAHDFIVHGLWPQYERGYPADCASPYGGSLPRDIADDFLDMTPSRGLLGHEWRKHGTCSGLPPRHYFEKAEAFERRIALPMALTDPPADQAHDRADLRARLIDLNAGLAENGFIFTCRSGRIAELRICFTKSGAFRRCGEDVLARACPRSVLEIPAD